MFFRRACFLCVVLCAGWLSALPALAQVDEIWHTPSDVRSELGDLPMRNPLFPGVEVSVTFYQGLNKGADGANQTGGTFFWRVNSGSWQSQALDFNNDAGSLQFWRSTVTMPDTVGAQVQYYFLVTFDNRDDTYLFGGDGGEDNAKSLDEADAQAEPYSFTVSSVSLPGSAELTVNGVNANYAVLNYYIDEVQDETFPELTITFEPGVADVEAAEVFTNLNNRDRANLDWDGDGIEDGIIPPDGNLITVEDTDTYFQAYALEDQGDGTWTMTLPVNKTGAYRLTARYRVEGNPEWNWIRDQGIRDLAIVVAPRIARDMVMYELHVTNANATGPTFGQRGTFEDLHDPTNDRVTLSWMREMGVNWIWFQPFHPQGLEGRETDPATGQLYEPGSPYSIRNFWEINPYYTHDYNGSLSDPWEHPDNYAAAMAAFQDFAAAADDQGVYLMLDFPFNHTSPDVVLGAMGVELFAPEGNPGGWDANDQIVQHVPQFFSTNGGEGPPAYSAPAQSAAGRAEAPDRNDFGKWVDVVDVYFGNYSTLVTGYPDEETSRQITRNEDDLMFYDSMGPETINVWRYFGEVLPYWIEQSGHRGHNEHDPEWDMETRIAMDTVGIDGLRKDFGQGLPPQAMEYIINRTHSAKWNFVFMSESLDGGEVTYRSSRHFAVLNENIVFPLAGATTAPAYRSIFEERRNAYGQSLVLLNNLSHDEEPYADPWQALIRYATVSTNDGAPMIMYGQEIGAAQIMQDTLPQGSWDWYEENFGKDIPHFKKWNSMQPQWTAWENEEVGIHFLRPVYSAIGQAREFSPALRSSNRWFMNRHEDDEPRNEIFSVAKYTEAETPLPFQDVVLAFTNLDRDKERSDTFGVPGDLADLLGMAEGRTYNVRNIAAYIGVNNEFSTRRDEWLWDGSGRTRQEIVDDGVFVSLNPVPDNDPAWEDEALLAPYEAQFLKVYDVTPPPAAGQPENTTGLTYTATGELSMTWNTSFSTHDYVTSHAVTVYDEQDDILWSGELEGTDSFSLDVSSYYGETVTVEVTPVSVAGISAAQGSVRSEPVLLLDPQGDEDGDGQSNLHEQWAGTDPLDPESRFEIIQPLNATGGGVSFDFTVVPGKTYQVFSSTDLIEWNEEGPPMTATEADSNLEFNDPDADTARKFYRVLVNPPQN